MSINYIILYIVHYACTYIKSPFKSKLLRTFKKMIMKTCTHIVRSKEMNNHSFAFKILEVIILKNLSFFDIYI